MLERPYVGMEHRPRQPNLRRRVRSDAADRLGNTHHMDTLMLPIARGTLQHDLLVDIGCEEFSRAAYALLSSLGYEAPRRSPVGAGAEGAGDPLRRWPTMFFLF